MFKNLFQRKKQDKPLASTSSITPEYAEDGLHFPPLHRAELYREGASREIRLYLEQLDEEGLLVSMQDSAFLPWEEYFQLLHEEEHRSSLYLLNVLPQLAITPVLVSQGSLSDADFRVSIKGWELGDGTQMSGSLQRIGAFVCEAETTGVMPEASWRVLNAVKELAVQQQQSPGEATNQKGWAKIRKVAKIAQARMDGFLAKTIVLSPDRININMRKSVHGDRALIEVSPGFADQPASWLDQFDAYQEVQDRYHILEKDGSIVHILVPPEVKEVLGNIKRLPGRRVVGDSALAFVRNPAQFLGNEELSVIDLDEFERSREEAAIFFHRFNVQPYLSDELQIARVVITLEPISVVEQPSVTFNYDMPERFAAFVQELEVRLAAGSQCGFWEGYEIELADFHLDALKGLQRLLEDWQQQALGQWLEGIFDLSQYGSRVVGIGELTAPKSVFIQPENKQSWLPEEKLAELGLDPELLSRWETDNRLHFDEFCERIDAAETQQLEKVCIPGLELEVRLLVAKMVRDEWAKKFQDKTEGSGAGNAGPRIGLQIESNTDDVENWRSAVQSLPADASPDLPATLRPEISLRQHQCYGLAWLQCLYRHSPEQVGGCVLADDMGLGKTLQLLAFIAWQREQEPQSPPVLIIAPVSLLDNWEREFDRFFLTAGMPVLKLYGDALAAVKLKRSEIPASLQAQGIRNLLRPGWCVDAAIVLTTYETLRDQELSFGRQKWSIVVCDEAQKIKNPGALVTQAAKALDARFRVACTGTPVENSLIDLWCLFDFAQPGLLGALNEFGRLYRRPIECNTDQDRHALEQLRALVAPQLLRRTKAEVADLPPKLEDAACRRLPISPLQDRLYQSELAAYRHKAELLQRIGDRNIAMLGLLHTLKLVCAHPHAVKAEGPLFDVSPKMKWLVQQLDHIRDKQEKAIIFTELRDIQRDLKIVIMDRFDLDDVPVVNGDTSATAKKGVSRQLIIDKFQKQPGFGVIILSTSAVGFGVNVQAANHVIHFTRPWNPAKEDQATDRAYRIGQEKPVHVYYPTIVAEGYATFENKLDILLSQKRELASDMYNGGEEVQLNDLVN
ncbi:type I Zorya anti-phage system protein ZorD [Chitinilyticum aquatile]|uniref:type I Zorya anti-phage system protein ZorD n=1 Tax=Chitinilyticum aquatile TaxID=362520 RepID=UPI00048E9889|nr:type I Zorya anti-phage system protein ZorD [Chitinilyticum aquatile]